MIVVNSLGNPASANPNKLYRLTKDNQIYYVNSSTLWVPMEAPGWPRRDGADDDEFEGTNSDPPSGWTWEGQNSTVVDTNNNRKSSLILTKTVGDGANIGNLYKAVSGLSSKRFYALCHYLSDMTSTIYQHRIMTAIRNSSNGKLMYFMFTNDPTGNKLSLYVQRWTAWNNYTSTAYTPYLIRTFVQPMAIVLSIRGDGTNIIFEYAPYRDGGENTFITIYSETIANFIGSMDQISVASYFGGGTTHKVYFDWARVI